MQRWHVGRRERTQVTIEVILIAIDVLASDDRRSCFFRVKIATTCEPTMYNTRAPESSRDCFVHKYTHKHMHTLTQEVRRGFFRFSLGTEMIFAGAFAFIVEGRRLSQNGASRCCTLPGTSRGLPVSFSR